ncbi:sphingosine kinase, putative [Perkinsus marinus ATCC 50983]|uniref:Sphingosine kinase, putative n=1 Tax=Perkinsus marinus (strain ATCC 50983 / TXsc) TaxID=423536 RepID=C5LKH5_PERM5|nr:sphingosine kinase, putative [Perkinsus marinus ATCC 50983]EER02742.1 sphingosine kinase, putative [Perkinsus marinus ATCC 50983]|eukprot:XP_002770926.1 sphingosine kinase, putative [Perkinsus marinus ATCC 50983]
MPVFGGGSKLGVFSSVLGKHTTYRSERTKFDATEDFSYTECKLLNKKGLLVLIKVDSSTQELILAAGRDRVFIPVFDVLGAKKVENEDGKAGSFRLDFWVCPQQYLEPSVRELKQVRLAFESDEARTEWYETLRAKQAAGKVLVFVNPYGGKRIARELFRKFLKPMFAIADVEYDKVETTHRMHIEEDCERLNVDRYRMVIVIGGDGTVDEAVNGLSRNPDPRARFVPVGQLPGGTANALAEVRGVANPLTASFYSAKGSYRPLDVMKVVNETGTIDIIATCMVSLGFISFVNMKARGWRDLLGTARYGVCGARSVICAKVTDYEADIKTVHNLDDMNSPSPCKGSSLVEDSRRSGDSNTTSGKLSTTDDVDVDFTGSGSVTKTRSDKGSYDIVSPELFRDVHNKHIYPPPKNFAPCSVGDELKRSESMFLTTNRNKVQLLHYFSLIGLHKSATALKDATGHRPTFDIEHGVQRVELKPKGKIADKHKIAYSIVPCASEVSRLRTDCV